MKVTLKNARKNFSDSETHLLSDFIKFLQNELPLKDDVNISFINKREGDMTTGVRKNNNIILVFCKNRLIIDVLRTLSHEWTHEYQHQTGYTKKHKHMDIGGPIENMANVYSGIFLKKFQKKHPQYEKPMYGE